MDKYTFPNDPVADPAAVVAGDQFRFTLISDTVLRYEWAEDGVFEDRPSTFAINRRFPVPKYSVVDRGDDQTEIITASFHVTYDKKRFSRHGLVVSFSNKNTLWGADWRYGDAPQTLGGTARTLDEVNGRCELEPGILSRSGYSVVDDSTSMLFDHTSGFVAPRRAGDRVDGYLFCYGFDYKRAMASFFAISGGQPVLPRWALGNWWSRYYAYTDQEYLKLMARFDEEKVPLSVAVIDMDWHVVKGDSVPHAGWTGYTWNKELFPDPKAFMQELHRLGLRITLNDHPHAGVHRHEDLYEAMAEDMGHDTSNQAPILFNPTDPKFMHAYLNMLHRSLERDGCDFWWIDWQQGPISRIPGIDPMWLLNHFHFLDHQMQQGPNGRGLIFSRYAGPGSHRYPVGFSGDSIMTWESLEFQPEFTATASNIGYGWWSHDIGGHMMGYRDDELAARWVQYGVFSPIMRLHSSNSAWGSKEPWLYRGEFAAVMRNFMRLRHRLLPYLHTMNVRSSVEGEPIVQPMYWQYPTRDEAYENPNQYFFGSELLVAPIVKPRDPRTNRARVDVWLPPAERYVDMFNGLIYNGDREVTMYRPVHSYPVLAPEGSIIPLDQEKNPGNGCKNPSGYEVLVVIHKDAEFAIREHIEDDAVAEDVVAANSTRGDNNVEGRQEREIRLSYRQRQGQLEFQPRGKSWTFKFVSVMCVPENLSVSINGKAVPDLQASVEEYPAAVPGLLVTIPKIPASSEGSDDDSSATAVLDLGPKPELSVLDVSGRIRDYILDLQVDMGLKDRIWGIVTSETHSAASKVARLTGLGEDEAVVGPIVEMLVADSGVRIMG
ncbi:Alpha-xylosidase-like protein [Hapsidospora chrysogenum ATCC 11550]|uniref:alpha-glucosidase n=1 Tax=Hapsidospora chrysogenum (strain ATCC 11550 / CBS 779.69 / DSM 880 / IAM 14645 / JCM 23072 / IMI 49137) TaxID=857340 RepID=A0A086T718_HAPC1|nr:Alpha-xylosidase-like protein [Hapsidospora chrysogenum ATCC 11550]